MTNTIDYPESFLQKCGSMNAAVVACLDKGDLRLGQFTMLQAAKAEKNRSIIPKKEPGDFAALAGDYAASLLGQEVKADVIKAVSCRALLTADHHGALFCSQQIQGDLLFSSLLRMLDYTGRYVPVFSSSQVELGNSTYARGVCAYLSPYKKQHFPIFPKRQSNRLASHTPPVDRERLSRFYKTSADRQEDDRLRRALRECAGWLFEEEEVLKAGRFADQATLAGARLSRQLFADDEGPIFVYLEMEEVIKPLIIRELHNQDSLLWKILYDPAIKRRFIRIRMPGGTPLGRLLFRGVDEKGRKIPLDFCENGDLKGFDKHKKQILFPTDPATLTDLLERRELIPGLLLFFLLLTCERGYTWMGGMFQALYLPQWQQCVCQLFHEAGYKEDAGRIRAYDCSGYINGPMFILHGEDGFSTTAGPLELWMKKPPFSQIRNMMRNTSLKEAHLIGLSEMYFDLVPPEEREKDWYQKIARGLADRLPENTLVS